LSNPNPIRRGIYKSRLVRRAVRWMDAMAHPPVAIEIALDRMAGVRWNRQGRIENFVVESLPPGALVPSAIETNIVDTESVHKVLARVCNAVHAHDEDVTLLLPDPVIRVFVQHFDEFPRSRQHALPMLRWKFKKSVPFAAEEMLLSYMRQHTRESGVDIVTALARQRIVHEYDVLAESLKLHAGVVLTSSLAAIALLQGEKPALMARIADTALTTAVVRDGVLCGYRCTELPARGENLTPAMLLDEIYPVAAYYQDMWHEPVQSVHIAGLDDRLKNFVAPLEAEFHCKVQSLLLSARAAGLIPDFAQPLMDNNLDGLIGWMLHHDNFSHHLRKPVSV
jgi:hypothetical protein